MSLLSEHTWEHHAQEATALLDAGLRIIRDEGMPREERASELDRLLRRLAGHQAALEIAADAR